MSSGSQPAREPVLALISGRLREQTDRLETLTSLTRSSADIYTGPVPAPSGETAKGNVPAGLIAILNMQVDLLSSQITSMEDQLHRLIGGL